jgi:hypothetical protein
MGNLFSRLLSKIGKKEPRVYALQRIEVLDEETCDQCKQMDTKVLTPRDKRTKAPLLHKGCRGIWVEILSDEVDPPPISKV